MNSLSMPALSKGLRFLIIATVGIWVVQIVPGIGAYVTDAGALVPFKAVSQAQVWRFITYVFLHDPHGPMHILFNMLALWMFGNELEEQWGTRRFVGFYCISGVGAGLFSVFWWHSFIIGASGAVLALLTVYAMYFPNRVILMFFVFPMPVRLAVVIIGAISLVGAVSGGGGDTAYLTHLGGIVIGFFYGKYYPSLAAWMSQRTSSIKKSPAILEFRTKNEHTNRRRLYEDEIDPILKKISEQGLGSLTQEERKKLEKASRKK